MLFSFSTELCVFLFFCFFLFLFFTFFIYALNVRNLALLYLKFQNKNENVTFNNFFDITKLTLQFFLFLCVINVFVLFFVYNFYNDFYINPLGAGFSLTFVSISLIFILNFFFTLYFLVFDVWFVKLKKYYISFFFRYEEFLIFFILHLVSFFLFHCKDWASFFINIELLSFCFYIFTGLYGPTKPITSFSKYSTHVRVLEASLKYLVPGLVSSLMLLLGIFLIYFFIGSLSFDFLHIYLVNFNQTFYLTFWFSFFFFLGFLCLLGSFCLKLNLVPFHTWVFWVYEGSLQHVVFFLSVISKLFYFLAFFIYICPYIFFLDQLQIRFVFSVLGLSSVIFSSFFGLFELRFNNLLAYSGVLNMGYSFLAISLFTWQGLALAFFSILSYMLFCLSFYFYLTKSKILLKDSFIKTIVDFKSFTFFNSWVFFFFIVIIFSLIGIPPLPGFYPKVLLFLNFFFKKNISVFVILLLSVVISSFFYLRWISKLNIGITLDHFNFWSFQYLNGTKNNLWSFFILFFVFLLSLFFVIDNCLAFSQVVLDVK